MNPEPTVIDMLIIRLITPLASTGSLISPETVGISAIALLLYCVL